MGYMPFKVSTKKGGDRVFSINWNGKNWTDAAGNVWDFDDQRGVFYSERWGQEFDAARYIHRGPVTVEVAQKAS